MNHELAKQLRDAGFPSAALQIAGFDPDMQPTLEELIEACGDEITEIYRADRLPEGRVWIAKCCDKETHVGIGPTPSEAVARLWLALNKK